MGWYLPHLSGYVTLRGTSRTSRVIKALLSPVPPRHPWLRHISTWAGNLSSSDFEINLLRWDAMWSTLKSKMVLTWADQLLSLAVFLGGWGVGRSHPSKCLGGSYQAEHSFISLKGGAWRLRLQLSSEATPPSGSVGLNWGLISSSHIQSEWNLVSVSETGF